MFITSFCSTPITVELALGKILDEVFFQKGLAKKYFNKADDFKDLAIMRNKIFKLN